MKKKYILISFILALSLVAIILIIKFNVKTKNNTNTIFEESISNIDQVILEETPKYEISTYVTNEIKEIATDSASVVCFKEPFTIESLKKLCTDIAIIRVISLDYMDMNVSMLGMTFGKALINNSIYGTLKEGDVITYMKPGGYVDMETYNNAQPEAARENRLKVREMYGITTPLSEEYANLRVNKDINIEEGKTYLAYLTYNEKNKGYEIIGLEIGLREVQIPQENEYVRASTYSRCTDVAAAFNGTDCKNNNWMYLNDIWWTMSPNSYGSSNIVWDVRSDGHLSADLAFDTNGVRPVVTLSSSVKITGGDRSSGNPYQLSL